MILRELDTLPSFEEKANPLSPSSGEGSSPNITTLTSSKGVSYTLKTSDRCGHSSVEIDRILS
jgi:hypothetical protein